MATNSVLLNLVGSDFQTPTQFTAQSPSLNRYFNIPNGIVKDFGDFAVPSNLTIGVGGTSGFILQPNGYIRVEFHENNLWKTGRLYTSQTGAQIATLFG